MTKDLNKYLKKVKFDGKYITSIFNMGEIKDKKINDSYKIFTYRDNNNDNVSEINYVPVSIDIPEGSNVKIYEKRKNSMIIGVKNEVWIDNEKIDADSNDIIKSNFWKLTFVDFERSSKKDEAILSKGALLSSKVSSQQMLIEDIVEFINGYSE